MKAWPDLQPAPSCARAACLFGCTFWSVSLIDRGRAVRGRPAIAAGSRSVPATTDESLHCADRRRECPPAARHGIGTAGSHESKFFPHDGNTAYHVGQFLSCRPTSGLTEPAVGSKGEFFPRRVLQAESHALGNIVGALDVIVL